MSTWVRLYRALKHGRKFAKRGKHCLFPSGFLRVEGHVELGDHVRIREGCVFRTHRDGKILIGSRGGCSFYCVFEATNLIQIGDFTGIAEFTVIRDTNHLVFGTDAHWRTTPHIAEPIIIGNSCLIGSRCYIGPGVSIGDGAVVAPGSIVTRNIGAYEIWAGAPARFVAHRTKNVPASVLRRNQELVSKYGIKEDRHGYYQESAEAAREIEDAVENEVGSLPVQDPEKVHPDILADE